MTINSVEQVNMPVGLPMIRKVNMTLNTIDKDRATLSVIQAYALRLVE